MYPAYNPCRVNVADFKFSWTLEKFAINAKIDERYKETELVYHFIWSILRYI